MQTRSARSNAYFSHYAFVCLIVYIIVNTPAPPSAKFFVFVCPVHNRGRILMEIAYVISRQKEFLNHPDKAKEYFGTNRGIADDIITV